MNLIHADLSKEHLFELLREFHLITFSNNERINNSFVVQRICKCHDLDIKFFLKMYITQSVDTETGALTVGVKVSLSTEAITLRKGRNFFDDYQYFLVSKDFEPYSDAERMLELYKELVDDIINNLNVFKVCKHCRLLYKDPRISTDPNHPCIHCLFDKVFHIRDCRCMVCNEDIIPGETSFTLTCGHTFHTECILLSFIKTKVRTCPLCRENDCHELP